MQKMKLLKDLNLMDRFLFVEAMEDPENLKTVVEIITQKEIALKYLPQTEKEERTSPANRFVKLDDGAVRILLNTKGRNPEEVSPELVELLKYMEHTNEETSRECKSERIRQMQERIKGIKSSEEVGVRYMQEWEERELERREALEEGRMSGLAEGRERGIRAFIEAFRETGMSKKDVEEKAADKFELDASEVEKYMKKYWIE